MTIIDTNISVKSDKEAELAIINMLSTDNKLDETTIANAITLVTTNKKAFNDGETIYIVHKQSKTNKDKHVYVHVAFWLF